MLKRLHPAGRGSRSRIASFAAALAVLIAAPVAANAAELVHVSWEGLSVAMGKTVSIAMPGGTVITGKAVRVEPDALLVDVKRTTDAKAWPKGMTRAPRATLRRFEMRTKGKAFRILMTPLCSIVGLVGGAFAAWGIEGGVLGHRNDAAAGAAFVGIWAGGTIGGYFAGNAADKHWTPVEVAP